VAKAALAQQEPRNQCGETCERAKLCAVCARGLEQQEQKPYCYAYEYDCAFGVHIQFHPRPYDGKAGPDRAVPLYAHPPRRETEQEPVALCDPAEYDDFQGAVSRNCASANSPKRHAPVTMETVYETIIHWDEGGGKRSRRELARRIVDLYTTPPRREWQGLTEKEREEATGWSVEHIEAALKERNT
jgi:hypothetical protein